MWHDQCQLGSNGQDTYRWSQWLYCFVYIRGQRLNDAVNSRQIHDFIDIENMKILKNTRFWYHAMPTFISAGMACSAFLYQSIREQTFQSFKARKDHIGLLPIDFLIDACPMLSDWLSISRLEHYWAVINLLYLKFRSKNSKTLRTFVWK